MSKKPQIQPKQLEMPLFIDVNSKIHQNHNKVAIKCTVGSVRPTVNDVSSLAASEDDLQIYRSISANYFRQFK